MLLSESNSAHSIIVSCNIFALGVGRNSAVPSLDNLGHQDNMIGCAGAGPKLQSPKLIQETSGHRRSSFDSVAETSLAAFDERLGPNHAGVEVLSSTCQQRVWFQLESCELFSAGLCPMPPNGIVTSAHHRKQVLQV